MDVKKVKRQHEQDTHNYVFEALLDDSLVGDVPVVEVFVGKVIDKRKISEIIVSLNRVHPIETLQHLKRINKDKILMCLKEDRTKETVVLYFQNLNFDLSVFSEFEIVEVPSIPPKTRRQYNLSNKQWPCNFHKNDYLEKLITGDCFSEEDQSNNNKWMQLAIEAGRRGEGSGAVVALGSECIAVAADESHNHPLQHAPMVAIDLIARSQGGGAWPYSPPDFYHSNPPSTDPSGPYLCTGYNIYLSIEPCTMCAMALIHSRIRRVFYFKKNLSRGAVASIAKIHSLKALNHHYEVFKVKDITS